MCLLMTLVMQLPTPNTYFLLTISKFTVPFHLLRTALYCSLTLTLYKVGALLTVWSSTSVKLKLYHSPGKLTYRYVITNFVNSTITQTNSIKDLRVFIDAKLHFHDHLNFISSQVLSS
jgi:hypothetical protein